PMWFSLKSTALKPARKIISALKMRGHAKRIPSWGFSFNVEVETRTGDSGDSYIPTFSGLAELNESDRANMDIIREQLIGEDVKNAPIDQEAPPTSDDDTGDF
ncbi:MAG: hypothetical protein U9N19_00520, partial [Thermodesulfobacteriota bacterium]|nr:hypothetical protein [Thermodesulfobacteriota bacterium]